MHLTVCLMVAVAFIFPSEGCQCNFSNQYYTGSFDIRVQDNNGEAGGYDGTFSVDVNGYYFRANLMNHINLGDVQLYAHNKVHLACYKNFPKGQHLGSSQKCDVGRHGFLLQVFPNCVPDQATYDTSKNEYTFQGAWGVEKYVVQTQSDGTCEPVSVSLTHVPSSRTYVYDNLMVDSARDKSYYSDPIEMFSGSDLDDFLG